MVPGLTNFSIFVTATSPRKLKIRQALVLVERLPIPLRHDRAPGSEVYNRSKPRLKSRQITAQSSSDSEEEATLERSGHSRKRALVLSESEGSSSSACIITGETRAQCTSDSEQLSSSGGSSLEFSDEETKLSSVGKGTPPLTSGDDVIVVSESDKYASTGDEADASGTDDTHEDGREESPGRNRDQEEQDRIEDWSGNEGVDWNEESSRCDEDWYQGEEWNRDEGGGDKYDNEYWNTDEAGNLRGGAGPEDWENWEEHEVSPSLLATPHQPTPSSCQPNPKELRMTNSTARLRGLFQPDIASRVSSALLAAETTTSAPPTNRASLTDSRLPLAAASASNVAVGRLDPHAKTQHTGIYNTYIGWGR